METLLACDLGTGGNKASLYSVRGECLASIFVPYSTYYPETGWHEQKPEEWWQAVCTGTKQLLSTGGASPSSVRCIALSGQSLAVVPLGAEGNLLQAQVPIWSDTRTGEQTKDYFGCIDQETWYRRTGNGFSRECYSIFKIMWYRDNNPDMFRKIDKIVGSKDYINYRLTGVISTDYSYASGSGVYNLKGWDYDDELLQASGIDRALLPDIVPSTHTLGTLTGDAAARLGLETSVKVMCGGVDNSCMALGAGNTRGGKVYLSLGSSAWIAVSSRDPVINSEIKPFVFTHIVPEMFTSATSIFSAGSSFAWLKDTVCNDLVRQAEAEGKDPFELMTMEAASSPVGANRLFFNPSLAGGSAAHLVPYIRGAFLGLDLRHTRADMIRAVMEGIAMDLAIMYEKLKTMCKVEAEVLVVGGGGKSPFWRQLFADIWGTDFVKADIDQEAASLGAAAVAAVGGGYWDDFNRVDEIIRIKSRACPEPHRSKQYRSILETYKKTWSVLADTAEIMSSL